ncbi:MAG: LCP family protein [Anaerolineae bacterium]|nr:LCP family protein [Anaerolineae bacterium]
MASTTSRILVEKVPVSVIIRVSLVIIFLVVTGLASFVVYTRVREEVARSEILPEFTIKKTTEHNESPNVDRPAGETLPVWTGTDPVTVLILGIDERAQEEEDYWRTDTMILATLDPVTMRAGVLSIPRDLWVPIPGYTENRINTAHFIGDAYDHPGGGPALAVETVQYNLGVEIDYYVRLNFRAFVDLVDVIGGIDIDVPETIDDPTYPDYSNGYDPFHIEAGSHHLYGEEALKYARTRYSSGGDFDRARRQQQVIQAILKRVTDLNLLPQLAARAPEIVAMVENSTKIDPNLQLDEIIALANLGLKVDSENIHYYVIDETCTLFQTTPDEQMILVPLRDRIREVRDKVFGLTNGTDQIQTVEDEAATVSVLNGTEQAGLAFSTGQYLEANGVPITLYDNADRQDYDTSLVILNRAKPATAEQILSLLQLPESAVVNGSNPTAEFDVVVILGADYIAIQQGLPIPQ